MLCKNRHGDVVIGENSQDNLLKLLYGNILGRFFLHLAIRPVVSKVVGNILSTKISCKLIEPFIKSNNIDMSQYIQCDYSSYNDFFTRKIRPDCRPICMEKNILISPCDGRVSAFEIDENSVFSIKGSFYTVESITGSLKSANHYKGGYCVIIRLCVDNYHRYAYPDNGIQGTSKFIPGVLHTVNPEALAHYDIYKENSRECTVLHTENFGKIMFIEVGALLVGKIKNIYTKGYEFSKGDEKGLFEFGGSTVVMLIEKDRVKLDKDILENTLEGFETAVKLGEQIGINQ